MLNALKSLFSSRSTTKAYPRFTLEGNVHIPPLNCFRSNVVEVLLDITGRKDEPFKEYSSLIVRSDPYNAALDFTKIHSLDHSKSKEDREYQLPSLEEFGRVKSEEHTSWTVMGCKNHNDKYFFAGAQLPVDRIGWNKRLHANNSDGSHHFAVSRFLISSGYPYQGGTDIIAKVTDVSINKAKAQTLFPDYHFFLVHKSASAIVYKHNNVYRQHKDYFAGFNTHDNMTIAIPKSGRFATPASHELRSIFLEQARINPDACVDMNHFIASL